MLRMEIDYFTLGNTFECEMYVFTLELNALYSVSVVTVLQVRNGTSVKLRRMLQVTHECLLKPFMFSSLHTLKHSI